MPIFYSPSGNPEIWKTCPDNYMTPDEWMAVHPAPEPTIDELKRAKQDEIAAARYAAETGGCTVDGVTIATDRGSQALLTAAVVTARLDLEFKTRWKCADGRFVTLDAMQLRAIGDAVIAHVEECFAHEGELCELIDAAQTPEDLAAITWSM
jgi:hypothetical protein